MAQLASDTPRIYETGDRNSLPVAAATKIYEGSAVGVATGAAYARPLQAGDRFVGFAVVQADNSAGGAGDAYVRTHKHGAIRLTVAGVATTSIGAKVYATDGNTFTTADGGGANTLIGVVARVVSAGVAVVGFDTAAIGA